LRSRLLRFVNVADESDEADAGGKAGNRRFKAGDVSLERR
jgi:hypothetical protein